MYPRQDVKQQNKLGLGTWGRERGDQVRVRTSEAPINPKNPSTMEHLVSEFNKEVLVLNFKVLNAKATSVLRTTDFLPSHKKSGAMT